MPRMTLPLLSATHLIAAFEYRAPKASSIHFKSFWEGCDRFSALLRFAHGPSSLSSSILAMIPIFLTCLFFFSFSFTPFLLKTGYGATNIEWMHAQKKHKTWGVSLLFLVFFLVWSMERAISR